MWATLHKEGGSDRESVGREVVEALDRARIKAGLSQAEMVQALSPYQATTERVPPNDRTAYRRWYEWRQHPQRISAMALVAAARIADMSLDELLGQQGIRDLLREIGQPDVRELKVRLEEMQAVVNRLVQQQQP